MPPVNEEEVDLEGLRSLYVTDHTAKALLDYAAGRTKNSTESTVDRLMQNLRSSGVDSRSELVAVLKQLDELGVGTFVLGRKGQQTRFKWAASMISVGKAAREEIEELEEIDYDELEEEGADELWAEHQYKLRPELEVKLTLPKDLTAREAKRLANFIRTLPFEGEEAEED